MRKVPDNATMNRKGALIVLFVFALPVILVVCAYAINIAFMQLVRTELRTSSDAAARAASRTLSITQSVPEARAAAIEAASLNTVAGTPLRLKPSEVVFGTSEITENGRYAFSPQEDRSKFLTGVRINANRTAASADGPITLLFSGVLKGGVFEPSKESIASHIDRDVFLVLDRSGSMGVKTPGGNRWNDLKKAVRGFFKILRKTPQRELVGLATYSTTATLDDELALKYNRLLAKVDATQIGGWTAIGEGMVKGIEGLTNPSTARPIAAKTLVVMTDGQHNRGIMPVDIAAQARALNITVHTITFSSGANQELMKDVARIGGGKHWHADDEDELIHVFEEVANNLPTLLTR